MNKDPIDHFIVALVLLVEGICWIINELAGHHVQPRLTFKPVELLTRSLLVEEAKILRSLGNTYKQIASAQQISKSTAWSYVNS